MLITTPQNNIIAFDARTGTQLWRYARKYPDNLFQLHPTNRGVALYGVDELFLLIGNVADEFTQALTAYGLSKKAEKAPGEMTGFKYLMIWHPRVNTDAAHAWLRGVSGESVRR